MANSSMPFNSNHFDSLSLLNLQRNLILYPYFVVVAAMIDFVSVKQGRPPILSEPPDRKVEN